MTDRIEALRAAKVAVESDTAVSMKLDECFPSGPKGTKLFAKAWEAHCGSLDAARALVKAVLPGWGYRVCECYLSDDAAVFPDFNCPEHGERLKREINPDVDWFDLTDVDQRPAGNPARALLLSVLIALIAIEEQSQ